MKILGFTDQTSILGSALWQSSERKKIIFYTIMIIATVAFTAHMQVVLNAWNQPFYNDISNKNINGFVKQLGHFALIAGVLLLLNVGQTWLTQSIKLALRKGLMENLLDNWLKPKRAYRLSHAGAAGGNPDQRLSDDTTALTQLTTDLAIGLLQALLLLGAFIGVLWNLSRDASFTIDGRVLVIPGYMVWCALLYSGLASFFSWWVGSPLVECNAERFAREADLRFNLMRVNEEIDAITLQGGEADEKARLSIVFATVVTASQKVIGALTRLTWITSGYGWFTIVAPLIVAAPLYFQGNMSFGQLMVVVGAFNQVQSSLRWFVDNFSMIADWRATLARITNFHQAILEMDVLTTSEKEITFVEDAEHRLQIDDLSIVAPIGNISLDARHVLLNPKERLHIAGDSGASKTTLFHTLAGLWPWGSGRFSHPKRSAMMFIPPRAYIPQGSLRSAVLYPAPSTPVDDAEIVKALEAVGLSNITDQIDKIDRWDKRLTVDEKQRLAFARVILQKPTWVILDDAWDAMDAKSSALIHDLFKTQLADVAVINIGHPLSKNIMGIRELRALTVPNTPTSHEIGLPGKNAGD